ncbi:hypothetical protein FRC01_007023 [Tulasnella sp. 417]|nr:hypothetical protein FRC01_007023 [Tulasnella sp. 417]
MNLHNLAQRNGWSIIRDTYPLNPAANEDWVATITVNGQVFTGGPAPRKQQAVDEAAFKALVAFGVLNLATLTD